MSLDQRVKKAECLTFATIPNTKTTVLGTWDKNEESFFCVRLTRAKGNRTLNTSNHPVSLEKIFVTCTNSWDVFENICNAICAHSMGAVIHALNNRDQEVKFCKDREVAQGYIEHSEWDRGVNNFHFALIQNKSGRNFVWAVIRNKMKTVDHGSFEERVNSMRGNEIKEEGID